RIACLGIDRTAFVSEARRCGAFLATWCNSETPDVRFLGQAASCAGIGVWVRTAGPTHLADELLNELDGLPLADVPRHAHEKKQASDKRSTWRHVSILYDHPDWPTF